MMLFPVVYWCSSCVVASVIVVVVVVVSIIAADDDVVVVCRATGERSIEILKPFTSGHLDPEVLALLNLRAPIPQIYADKYSEVREHGG